MFCVKTKFRTEQEAEIALQKIKGVRRKYRREKKPKRYYLCDKCNHYHLTSKDAIFPEENFKLIHSNEFKHLIKKED